MLDWRSGYQQVLLPVLPFPSACAVDEAEVPCQSRNEGGGRADSLQTHNGCRFSTRGRRVWCRRTNTTAAQTGCFFFLAVAQAIMLNVNHKPWTARQLIIFDTSLKKACPPRQIGLLPTDGTADI